MALSAQQTNTDSLSLVSKISDYQLQLGKLQNKVDQMTRDKHDAATKAQQSADDNATAADRLSADSKNKSLAKEADNKAGDAKSDSKKARQTSDKLSRLKKDIQDIQGKIADEQRKLDVYRQGSSAATIHP
jgi:chromosome segregation ATPase